MIKHFSVLYVGNIDLDDVGLDGTPADERRYSNDRLIGAFESATQVAELMDGLGFYALWLAEHHFQREGYECFPNLIVSLPLKVIQEFCCFYGNRNCQVLRSVVF